MEWLASDRWLGWWAEALVRGSVYGGLAVIGAWGACRLVPGTTAVLKSWLWRLVYLKIAWLVVWPEPLRLGVLTPPAMHFQVARLSHSAEASARGAGIGAETVVRGRSAGWIDGKGGVRVAAGLWCVGVLWVVVRTVRGSVRTRRLVRECRPVTEKSLHAELAWVAGELRCKGCPRLLWHAAVDSPQAVGLWRPAIVLPAWFMERTTRRQQRLVLAHELTHIRRRDLLWGWIRRAVNGLLFFHPLLWVAEEQAALCEEMAGDEAAVRSEPGSVSEYGGMLVKVAGWGGGARTEMGGWQGVGMSRAFRRVAGRLVALEMAGEVQKGRLGRTKWWKAGLVGTGAAALLGAGLVSVFQGSGVRQLDPRYPVLGYEVSRGKVHHFLGRGDTVRFAGLSFSRLGAPPASRDAAVGGAADRSGLGMAGVPPVAKPGGARLWLERLNASRSKWAYHRTLETTGESWVIRVRFGQAPEADALADVVAVLEDEAGERVPLMLDRTESVPGLEGCAKYWVIDPAPEGRAKFRLWLEQGASGQPLALIHLREGPGRR